MSPVPANFHGRLPKKLKERDFQDQILRLAKTYGWRVAHFRTSQQGDRWLTAVGADGKGWPDLTLVHECGIFFREIKTDAGRLSLEQKQWGADLEAAGGDWAVWKPEDWPEIIIFLSDGRARQA